MLTLLQWPTINGEKPFTLPYGPNHWCHPLVTMHHMNSEEISTFWEWETKRYADPAVAANPPVTRIKDVFEAFMKPRLVAKREDWDNRAEDRFFLVQTDGGRQFADWEIDRQKKKEELTETEKVAHENPEACSAACRETDGCFSWRWQNGLCGLSWTFRMGHPVKKAEQEKDRFTSGWNIEGINKFISNNRNCGKAKWPEVP